MGKQSRLDDNFEPLPEYDLRLPDLGAAVINQAFTDAISVGRANSFKESNLRAWAATQAQAITFLTKPNPTLDHWCKCLNWRMEDVISACRKQFTARGIKF